MPTRTFCASFSVRIDTRRVRFELAPAPEYGGPEGTFRVRVDRRWHDSPDGEPWFFDRAQLAGLVAGATLGVLPEPAPMPEIPVRSRVTVRQVRDGEPCHEGGWTVSPPVLAASGRWVVAVNLADGTAFVPVDDCTFEKRRLV